MIKDFLSGIRHFFHFSRKETIVFVSISAFTILVMIIPFFISLNVTKNQLVTPEDIRMLDSLVTILEKNNKIQYFEFDPNIISEDSMYLLGISPLVVHNWMSYRDAGGKFKYKSDLAGIYSFDSLVFDSLKSYISLPDKPEKQEKLYTTNTFDINKATREQLMGIYGIGEKLSARIIKYRDLLGGYANKQQYEEVYYLEGKALQNLKKQTFISDDYQCEKININKSSFKEIIRHPYIDKNLTQQIVNSRNGNNSYLDQEKFKSMVDNDSLYSQLLPYIGF